jgi:hypothetical protein
MRPGRVAPAHIGREGCNVSVTAVTRRNIGPRRRQDPAGDPVRAVHEWNKPALALLRVVLMEFDDFAIMRRMLYGIKERAETLHAKTLDA